MGLKNANTAVDNSAFEGMEDEAAVAGNAATEDTATAAVAGKAATEVVDPAPAAKTSALAVPQGGRALTSAAVVKGNVLSGLKDAFHVTFDAVPRVKAEQGEMVAADDEVSLGRWVEVEVMSYQDQWVASPGDNKAPVELVKFSDNAHTTEDGTDLDEHVRNLVAQGYKNAKKQQRLVVVGELVAVASDDDAAKAKVGGLVQINLPDSGRRSFNGHTLQASFQVAKGRKTQEEAAGMRFTATKEKSKSGDSYTKTTVGFVGQ